MGIIKKWDTWISTNERIINYILLLFLSVSFMLTDWMVGIFSLSEYLLGLFFVILILSNNLFLKKRDYFRIFIFFIFLTIHNSLHFFISDQFSLKLAVPGMVKLLFYSVIVLAAYRFIAEKRLEEPFLKIINISAFLIIIVGLYITLAIYSNGEAPYEFFWTFTRTDPQSYLFRGTKNLVRMRSVFAEPSHLGYFLNTILSVNFFNNQQYIVPKWMNVSITVGIIMTFSYGSIAIMSFIYILMGIRLIQKRKISMYKKELIGVGLVLVLIILFLGDYLEETILNRTFDIINGTDNSSLKRLAGSWMYVNQSNIWLGNGIGHTPSIWNVYAYILSDLGLVPFLVSLFLTGVLIIKNYAIGVTFVLQNFQKGGYLSPAFYLMLLIFMIYSQKNEKIS